MRLDLSATAVRNLEGSAWVSRLGKVNLYSEMKMSLPALASPGLVAAQEGYSQMRHLPQQSKQGSEGSHDLARKIPRGLWVSRVYWGSAQLRQLPEPSHRHWRFEPSTPFCGSV